MTRKEREEEKKQPSPYLSKLSWKGLSKYTTATQWKNDTSGPGFEWHGGFGQNPLQTGIYFPFSGCVCVCVVGEVGRRKWPRRKVMANIFWICQVLLLDSQGQSLLLWLE